MKDYRFSNRMAYFRELTAFARQAGQGDRIAVMAMSFDPSAQPVGTLAQALTEAAGRGAQVVLSVDALNFIFNYDPPQLGPLWFGVKLSTQSPEPFGGCFSALEALQEAGGRYVVTNQPKRRFTLPQARRSHSKLAVLNDRVYIGGHNLGRPEDLDVMVSWDDRATADYLFDFTNKVANTGSPRRALHNHDARRQVDDDTILLFDAGVPRQSLILDEALQLIDEAQERIFMTCQYFPGGRTGQHLAAALRRGVDVTLHYSPPKAQGHEAPAHHLYALREQMRLPAKLFVHQLPKHYLPKLHAKVLVSEKAAMIGSHNYVVQGVRLGTAEIALHSRDREFGVALVAAVTALLPK
jgi:phosphatidylserine/phosphatidylglycerophosphate/cardiolipin synthase-like enzyme